MWPHRVIDDFLDEDVFAELSATPTDHVGPTQRELTTTTASEGPQHDVMMQLLEELAPEKVKLYNHSDMHILICGKDYKYKIHDDVPEKILSGVVYLAPEKNRGTLLYSSKDGDDRTEVEWKQNRALIFSREERKTWHSVEGDGINTRLVLVYNLRKG